MSHAALETAIDAAWDARDGISPATRGEARDAIEATLTAYSSQSVQAFNHQFPGEPYASITFAVTTIEAALAEVKDAQGFDLLIGGQSVAKLDWHGGLAARKQLEKCLSKRKAS